MTNRPLSIILTCCLVSVTSATQLFAQDCWVFRKSDTNTPVHAAVAFSDSLNGFTVGGNKILRTTDGGRNWKTAVNADVSTNFSGISAGGSNVVIAVGTEFDTSYQGVIYRTSNGGTSWSKQTSPSLLQAVSLCNSNAGAAVAFYGKILWTNNGGNTWATPPSGVNAGLNAVFCVDDNTAFAVGNYGIILRTTDAGLTWTSYVVGGSPQFTGVGFANANLGITVDYGGSVFRTTDGGISWAEQQSLITGSLDAHISFVDPNNAMMVAGRAFRSADGGTTWQAVGYPSSTHRLNGLAFPFNDIARPILVGYDGSSLKGVIVQAIADCSPYPPVIPLSPVDGKPHQAFDAVSSSALTLTWDCLPLVTVASSSVQVALDPSFTTLIADTAVALDGSLVNTSLTLNLLPGTTYYWHVRINPNIADWSPIWSFTTAKAAVNGKVFEDINRDGIQDNGEQNLAGRQVDISGSNAGTVYTDSLGTFSFWGLDSGSYTVKAWFPASWVQSVPSSTYNVSLGVNDTSGDNIFGGYFPWNSVSGILFNDRNDNGVKESWEEGLAGWKVSLGGISMDSVLTDSLGQFDFERLVLGDYSLTPVIQPTWEQVFPRFQEPQSVTFNNYDQHPSDKNIAVHKIPERLKLTLTVQDNVGVKQRDIWFGHRPGATFGIWGADAACTYGDFSEGEAELPPNSGLFEARFLTPRAFNSQFGNGSWTDMRSFYMPSQIDTYKVNFRPQDPTSQEYSFTLSWSQAQVSASYAGPVTMLDRYNNATDMKTQNSRTITDQSVSYVLIVTGNPSISMDNIRSWHMISLPYDVSNKQVGAMFPSASSQAFSYSAAGGYQTASELVLGRGYWLKYSKGQDPIPDNGPPLTADTIDAEDGWNMIGSIASSLNVSDIHSIPPGIATSQFFGYSGAYFITTTIEPGQAYWAKVNQAGQLILSSTPTVNAFNRIRIVPTSDRPPTPPDGMVSNPKPKIPNRFGLEQNYPNPFNPVTQIRYSIRDAGYVTLKIYNVLGQEVATLVDQMQEAGYKNVAWDAGKFTSGLYFYRLASGPLTDIKKLLLLK